MDPSFTRIIKLDILTALALEPAAIEAVLKEFRTYIRHSDKTFACAAIQAVGTVVELARIVHDRHGAKTDERARERQNANTVALNCLHGLVTLTKASENSAVVGECVIVIQRILLLLGSGDSAFPVEDPNHVQDKALRRIFLLLVNALNVRIKRSKASEEVDEDDDAGSDDEGHSKETSFLGKAAPVDLPPEALASAVWVVGEWMASLKQSGSSKSSLKIRKLDRSLVPTVRLEVCRLLAAAFTALKEPSEKEQAIHFATKMLVSSKDGFGGAMNPTEVALCETILSMGRLDVNPDVRDRARHESNLIQLAIGLQYDQDGMEPLPSNNAQKPTIENVKCMLMQSKPACSSLPLEEVHFNNKAGMGESGGEFRFGTLSSLVRHRARTAYLPLPAWSDKNSPSSLRDPAKAEPSENAGSLPTLNQGKGAGFYEENESTESSSSSDNDSSDSSSSSDDSSSTSSDGSYDGDDNADDSDSSSSNDSGGNVLLPTMPSQPYTSQHPQVSVMNQPPGANGDLLSQSFTPANNNTMQKPKVSTIYSDSENSESSSSSSSSSDDDAPTSMGGVGNLIPMGGGGPMQHMAPVNTMRTNGSASTSAADDLKGLVLEPVVVDATENGEPNIERDSSAWIELVRPQYAGGLCVLGRYLRGQTKTREVKLLGMTAENASTVCLQLKFENK